MKKLAGLIPAGIVIGYLVVHGLSQTGHLTLPLPRLPSSSSVFRGNVHRSGEFNSSGLAAINQVIATDPAHAFGVPAFDPKCVCFGYSDGVLCGVDPKTGRMLWQTAVGFLPQSVVVTEGVACAAGMEAEVAGVDLATGRRLWKLSIPRPNPPPPPRPQPCPEAAYGRILFGCFNDLHAINPKTGAWAWALACGQAGVSCIGFDADTVYCIASDGRVFAAQSDTGSLRWKTTTAALPAHWIKVHRGSVCYAGGGYLNIVDPQTGRDRWAFAAPGNPAAIVLVDDAAYLPGNEIYRAVLLYNGKEKWRTPVAPNATAAIHHLGRVIVATGENRIVALDADTGKDVWRCPTDWPADALSVNRGLVLASNKPARGLCAINSATGRTLWTLTGVQLVAAFDDVVCLRDADGRIIGAHDFTGGEKWRIATPLAAGCWPVQAGQTIHFGAADGYFYAVDIPTGLTVWRVSPQTSPVPTPAVTGSDAVFARGPTVFAWNHAAASAAQSSGPRALFTAPDVIHSSPVVDEGVVYFGCDDGCVYAVSLDSGSVLWKYCTEGAVYSSPAVVGDTVYFGSFDRNVYAVDAQSGEKRWQFRTAGPIASSPAVADDTVFIGTREGRLYALETAKGTLLWRFKAGGPIDSAPALLDEFIYLTSTDGCLYRLDRSTGKKQWKFKTGGPIVSSPAATSDTVYTASRDGNLYAVDAKTGAEKWRFNSGAPIDSSPALAGGIIVFGNDYEFLYAIDAETGGRRWRYELPGGPISSSPVAYVGTIFAVNGGRIFLIR